MDCLVEVHDEDEVELAVDAGAEVIGINNRNLHSLEVDLRHHLPAAVRRPRRHGGRGRVGHHPRTTTSRRSSAAGVDAILVGEALMGADDPGHAIRALMGG